jgi:homoserine dehydrogenase
MMDGTPIFNLFERTLPLVEIKSICGIINSTTNYILTGMEQGKSYDAALKEAQELGVAEADPSLDVDGWDAAVKATVLANCLMGGNLKPHMVSRTGIRDLDSRSLVAAKEQGKKIRLVTRVERHGKNLMANVKPETIPEGELLSVIDSFSNAIIFETDLMGTIAIVEKNPNLTQTAYGLLSDLLSVVEYELGK